MMKKGAKSENNNVTININKPENIVKFFKAIDKGNSSLIKSLIGNKIDVNAILEKKVESENNLTPLQGIMPLHLACKEGAANNHLEIVELLIRHKADVNAKDTQGKTPLHWADDGEMLMDYSLSVMKILFKNKADINAKNNMNETSLHLANNIEALKFLLENKADVSTQDMEGNTPLHRACNAEIKEDIKLLCADSRIDTNVKNYYGDTPLHIICKNIPEKDIVKCLLETRADIYVKNHLGKTPLDMIYELNNQELIKLFENILGININFWNTQDQETYSLMLENYLNAQKSTKEILGDHYIEENE